MAANIDKVTWTVKRLQAPFRFHYARKTISQTHKQAHYGCYSGSLSLLSLIFGCSLLAIQFISGAFMPFAQSHSRTSVNVKMAVFWVVAPCSLVEVCRRFRGACCLLHQGALMMYETKVARRPSFLRRIFTAADSTYGMMLGPQLKLKSDSY
jgi:hypothetical protein